MMTFVRSNMHYGRVAPLAQYSPWLDDAAFQEIYANIKANTFVDIYRCFELWQLVAQLGPVPGDLLEVGVWRGGTGTLMAHQVDRLGLGRKVFLCDTFRGVVKATEKDSSYRGGEHSNTSQQVVEDLLEKCKISSARILTGIFPDDTGHLFDSASLALIHIDVDVYRSGKDIMDFLWDRLVVGGVVVFDDYGFISCDGIATLVNEYRADSNKLVIHNLNGHGLVVKTGY